MKQRTRIPNKGYWFFVECQPFTTDADLQDALYRRCGMDVSIDRIDVRPDETGLSKYWRAVVSLLPCHIDQMANFCLDAGNLAAPIFFLPFPSQQKTLERQEAEAAQ